MNEDQSDDLPDDNEFINPPTRGTVRRPFWHQMIFPAALGLLEVFLKDWRHQMRGGDVFFKMIVLTALATPFIALFLRSDARNNRPRD
jgi:hypothetical protein